MFLFVDVICSTDLTDSVCVAVFICMGTRWEEWFSDDKLIYLNRPTYNNLPVTDLKQFISAKIYVRTYIASTF